LTREFGNKNNKQSSNVLDPNEYEYDEDDDNVPQTIKSIYEISNRNRKKNKLRKKKEISSVGKNSPYGKQGPVENV